MSRALAIRHEFVATIPDRLDDRVVYVSIPYATAVHLCCCGCGSEVVTPLSPTDWSVTFDGQSVSLRPSIGNWSFECQSHYWIEHNRIRWARSWSRDEIAVGRERDALAKQAQFRPGDPKPEAAAAIRPADRVQRLRRWLQRLRPRRNRGGQSGNASPSTDLKVGGSSPFGRATSKGV